MQDNGNHCQHDFIVQLEISLNDSKHISVRLFVKTNGIFFAEKFPKPAP